MGKRTPDLLPGLSGLEKHQQSVLHAVRRSNFWVGAVRAGKSRTSAYAWLDYLLGCPRGSIHVVVGQHIGGALAVLVDEILQDMLGDDLVRKQRYVEVYGRRVYVMGAYDRRAIQRLAGRTFWSAWGDEVNEWPEKYYRFLMTRLSRTRQDPNRGRFFGTANPGHPGHWLLGELEKGMEAGRVASFHMGLRDNEFMDLGYIEELEREMRDAGPAFYGNYILGEWVMPDEAIYPMVMDCVVDGVPVGVDIVDGAVGADSGSRAATAFVYLGLGSDKNIYVLDELYWDPRDRGRRLTEVQQAELFVSWVRDKPNPNPVVFVDPNAQSLVHALRDLGQMARFGDNNVKAGVGEAASLMGKGVIRVLRGCSKLVVELANYSYDPRAAEKGQWDVLKLADHAADAFRYCVRGTYSWWKDRLVWDYGPTRGKRGQSRDRVGVGDFWPG